MKLTTKRNRWYFWRELFSYMIPMILIVGIIDVFHNFMICPLHPEWSAPCDVNWIFAAIYGGFLLLVIIFAIISANMLRRVKKKIEAEFMETVNNKELEERESEKTKEISVSKPKKLIAKSNKSEKKEKNVGKKTVKKNTKKTSDSKNVSTKKKTTKK